MIGLKIVKFTDILPITEAELLTEDPPVIRLKGSGFRRASDVLINGKSSTIEKIYDDAVMDIVVPDELKDVYFETLIAISDTYSGLSTSQIGFGLGSPQRKITGAPKLLQHFIKLLLTTPDLDIFNKGVGGGLQGMGGVITSAENAGPLAGRVLAAIRRTAQQMLKSQAGRSMPADEKLRSAEALDLTYDKYSSTLMVKVALRTAGGSGVIGSLGL